MNQFYLYLYIFTKIYSDSEPDLEEGDVFKINIPLVKKESKKIFETNEEKVLVFLKKNGKCTSAQLLPVLNFKSKTSVQKLLSKMIEDNLIQKNGAGKNIYYYLK